MMLLQAGQMGLYRKDSIWTDAIQPEMVAGCTMWLDYTDTDTLWSNTDFTGSNVTTNGTSIITANNKIDPDNGVIEVSSAKLKTPAVNGQSSLLLNTPAGRMDTWGKVASVPVSSFLTSTTKLVVVGAKVTTAVAADGSPWFDDSLFCDASGYFGLQFSNEGGPGLFTARAFNYVAGAQEVTRTFAAGEWAVFTFSHQSGQLRLRVNGGAWATVSSGATATMGGTGLVGYSRAGTGRVVEIAHIVTVNTAQNDAGISAVEHWMALDVGITPWW